jgi:hypothetical protein
MVDLRAPLLATAALLGGPVLFLRGFRVFRTCQLIRNTPTARIRSMAMGLVEVKGDVAPRSGVTAPFSGRPCAYWEVDIAVRGKRRNGWTVIHRNQSGQPFYLSDETGRALVFPHGAECRVHVQVQEECAGWSLPDCYSEYLRDHPLGFRSIARLGTMRFRERLLEEGHQVYVLGSAFPSPRQQAVVQGEWLEATGTDAVDADWAANGGRDERPAHDGPHALRASRIRDLDQDVQATIRRGENERTFIISQHSEHDLTFALTWKGWGMLIGGPLLALIGLGYWLVTLSTRIL